MTTRELASPGQGFVHEVPESFLAHPGWTLLSARPFHSPSISAHTFSSSTQLPQVGLRVTFPMGKVEKIVFLGFSRRPLVADEIKLELFRHWGQARDQSCAVQLGSQRDSSPPQ